MHASGGAGVYRTCGLGTEERRRGADERGVPQCGLGTED